MESWVGAIDDSEELGLIPRILLATDGAITHILEAYAGEPVDFVSLASSIVSEPSERREHQLLLDERALRRVSLLRGRASGRVFVHADSLVILDRLPEPVVDAVLSTGASLLKVLAQHRIGTFRETVADWEGTDEAIAPHLGIHARETQVGRTYQVVLQGRPVAWITERFPKLGFSPPYAKGPAGLHGTAPRG